MRFSLALLLSAATLFGGDLSGRRAPGFSLSDMQFRQHDVMDYRGRILIIDLMQTSCPHCQTFSRILERIVAKYPGKVAAISVVNPPDNQQTVNKFIADNKITTPVVFDCGQMAVSYMKATPQKPSVDLPHVFIVDPNGMIVNDYAYSVLTKGVFEGDALDKEIAGMLSGGGKPPAKKK